MKLKLKTGQVIELVNHCKKDKVSGMMVEQEGVYAIPGGAVVTAGAVISWEKETGAAVVEL